ncbi:MFS transporter [Sporolactobacillus putidus]|uniref:MFS transporter n=1 Tax=Sporolactobacillus putidus TaxID=492735 RepID=A0A917S8U7_9BACL|nr:MFS transporter [Sporolactobacillus putidus]GGL62013.1 MFS transporter [Sporolactobacillus putidus]
MKIVKWINPRLALILFGLLITNTGSFMILPFLSLYLSSMKLSTGMIGVVLMVNILCQRGLTFFGGILNDRFGERKLLIIGLSVRLLGYIIYSFASHIFLIFLASAFVGLGGALFAPGLMATIAKLAGDFKPEVFALRNTVINIGSSLGPILGGLLYQYSILWVFILTSLAHLIFLLLIQFAGPDDITAKQKTPVIDLFRFVLQDHAILILALMNATFWFVYSQFNLVIPLYMQDFFQKPSLTGLLFTMNGLFVTFLQYAIAKFVFQKFSGRIALLSGFLSMSAAYFILGLVPYLVSIFLFVLLFSTSEVLIFPTIDNLVSEMAPEDRLSTCYGFVDLGWAAGAASGNLLGGLFFGFVQTHHLFSFAWFSYGSLSLLAILFVFLISQMPQTIHSAADREDS